MVASRPRNSVLYLFDPLADDAECPSTPDPAESDKENSSPPAHLSLSAFFTRTYKSSHTLNPAPHVPKRRLIDIGDMTIDDASFHEMFGDTDDHDHDNDDLDDQYACELTSEVEDDENDTLTFRDMAKAATPNWKHKSISSPSTPSSSTHPRTPLAELPIESDSTPTIRTKVYRRQCNPVAVPSKLSQVESPAHDVLEVPNLDSIISAVNQTGTFFGDPNTVPTIIEPITLPKQERTADDYSSSRSTDSLSASVSTLNLEASTGSLLTEATIPVLISPPSPPASRSPPIYRQTGLRPNAPNTSSNSLNRHSIDLHTSFQLQLQSSDSTFDLLNDKISFFDAKSGMDSFLNALEEEDSFDMELEKENMELALKEIPKVKDYLPDKHAPGSPSTEQLNSPSGPIEEGFAQATLREGVAVKPGDKAPSPTSSTFFSTFRKRGSIGASPLPSRNSSTPQPPLNAVFIAPPPIATPEMSRPSIKVPPLAIPALRIVKRSKTVGHEKTNSGDSASSSGGLSGVPGPISELLPSVPTVGRIQRTASASNRLPATSSVPPPVRPTKVSPVASSRATGQQTNGPRRVLISGGSSSLGKVTASATRPTSTTSGARRVVIVPEIPSVKASSVCQVLPAPSGLKQPMKYGNSALPKPVPRSGTSRLPAPSSTSTVRKPIELEGSVRTVPVRRVI
ncbi:hypothetical protein BDQ12DRAFT_736632 [Crucibulum laeve]|uniref:Uncharacterized protein n=1 Tax=Crucibulum laeve TaxID=68775 RepID=A0A5C3LUX0_9AGAR|nr:hypothetical protein BDQ12DRAFT_736632 [Crucibulum laeve]